MLIPGVGGQYASALAAIEDLEVNQGRFDAFRERVDLVLKGAYALNQEAHCHDHKDEVFELLSAQTKLLREAIEAIKLQEQLPVAAPLPPVLDWKDTAVELPDDNRTVLVACADDEVDAAFLVKGMRWVWQTGHDVSQAVVAWCNMPESPKVRGART